MGSLPDTLASFRRIQEMLLDISLRAALSEQRMRLKTALASSEWETLQQQVEAATMPAEPPAEPQARPAGRDKRGESEPNDPCAVIPEGWRRQAVALWRQGYTAPEIGKKLHRTGKTVGNALSALRQHFGTDVVPLDAERRKATVPEK